MQTEEEIVAHLAEAGLGKLWEDPDFPADASSLYRSKYSVAAYDKGVFDQISWLRPHEFVTDPDYFKDTTRIGDLVDARGLDDSWFLGALALVASHPDALLENVFASAPDGIHKYGLFTARFYKNGDWKEVVTDTRIPCAMAPEDPPNIKFPRTPVPLYGRCTNLQEQWIALLEKAYAKLHGSYEALHTGSPSEAIVDLTGGSVHKIYLNEASGRQLADSGVLWDMLVQYRSQGCMLGASHAHPGAPAGEETFFGLAKNRLYPIIDLKEIYNFRLVRVRLPYRNSCWRGDWANDSHMWSEYPEVLAKIRTDPSVTWVRSEEGDGTTWMAFQDLVTEFNKVYVGFVFHNDKHKQYVARGEWVGKTAGGAPGYFDAEAGESSAPATVTTGYALRSGSTQSPLAHGAVGSQQPSAGSSSQDTMHRCLQRLGDAVLQDGDAYWFNNPQYRLTVTHKTQVYISLMQQDRRGALALRENHPVGFEVIRLRKDNSHFRVWDYDPALAVATSTQYRFAQREVTVEALDLEPGFSYNIVPHAHRHAREGKFIVRVFTREPVLFEKVPETFSTYVNGAWDRTTDRDSTGGPLLLAEGNTVKDNYKWCQNPQYWVRVPDQIGSPNAGGHSQRLHTVDLKIVLRRTDKHRRGDHARAGSHRKRQGDSEKESDPFLGVVVCRAPIDSTTDKQKRQQQQQLARKPSDSSESTKSPPRKESTLKPSPFRRRSSPEDKDATLIQRKLYIRKEEWVRVSDYSGTEEACMTLMRLDPTWIPRGLLVIPTLSERNTRGTFSLEVHSDMPGVTVQELLESKTKTLTGAWDTETAGGSHLHPDWRKNPKFTLKLNCSEEAVVKIALTRAEKEWRAQCTKDPLGCMIGFYIYTGPKPTRDPGMVMHEGRPWTESAFVPMHEVSTPTSFTLKPLAEEESYMIMPTTFEPGKKGGFFLSVITDADFVLRKDSGPSNPTAHRHQR